MHQKKPTRKRGTTGFTMIELMITVSILAILLALAVPDFQRFIQRARIDRESMDLQGFLMQARSESIKRGQNVWISSSTNNWTGSLRAFVDTNGNQRREDSEPIFATYAAPTEIALVADTSLSDGVGYSANGTGLGNLPNGSVGIRVPNLIGNPNFFVGRVSFGTGGRTTLLKFKQPVENFDAGVVENGGY